MKNELDNLDWAILRELQADGRQPSAKLAERLMLSETPCWRRIRHLEAAGYICDYQANIDRRKVGFSVLAFVSITVSMHTLEFEQAILAHPEVISFHTITGKADFLLEVVAVDLDTYGRFVDTLRKIPTITSLQSSFSIREVKSSKRIPIDPEKIRVNNRI